MARRQDVVLAVIVASWPPVTRSRNEGYPLERTARRDRDAPWRRRRAGWPPPPSPECRLDRPNERRDLGDLDSWAGSSWSLATCPAGTRERHLDSGHSRELVRKRRSTGDLPRRRPRSPSVPSDAVPPALPARPSRDTRPMIRAFRPCAILLPAVIVEMSGAEFMSVKELSDRRRRARFALPDACRPALTAIRGRRGRVHVVVTDLQSAGSPFPSSAEDSPSSRWKVKGTQLSPSSPGRRLAQSPAHLRRGSSAGFR